MASDFKKNAGSTARTAAAIGSAIVDSGLTGKAASLAVTAAIFPELGPVSIAAAGVVAATLMAKYTNFLINKKTAPVNPVSDKWKTRPKANMVKWMMKQSGVGLETVADYLGCTVSYLNTKLARDSFSFEDLIIVAYACGYTFVLANNNGEEEPAFRVDIIRHFENSEPEVLERINEIEEKAQLQAARREEYEKKKAEIEDEYAKRKAELEKMREEYGIEE